jgi:hypothetical protein
MATLEYDDEKPGGQLQYDPTWGEIGADVGRSLVSGVGQGAVNLTGLPGDIEWLAKTGYNWATGNKPAPTMSDLVTGAEPKVTTALPTSAEQRAKAEKAFGSFYKPTTTYGEFAKTAGEFIPGAVAIPGGVGASVLGRATQRALQYGVAPGIVSEAAGQVTKGSAAEPYARIGGALIAPRLITPLPQTPMRAGESRILQREGIGPVSAGQSTGARGLIYAESETPGFQRIIDRQNEALTAAMFRNAGQPASTRATTQEVDNAFREIGARMDNLGSGQRIPSGEFNQIATDMVGAGRTYSNATGQPFNMPIVQQIHQHLTTGMPITGRDYQSWTSELARAARNTGGNHALRNALYDSRAALDDAMERTLVAAGRGDEVAAFREARRHYANMTTIERAALNAHEGLITPAAARSAFQNTQGRSAYTRGRGEMNDLIHASSNLLRQPPNSGTAGRLAAQALFGAPGAMVGYQQGDLTGAALGSVFGAVGGRYLAGRTLMSRPVQGYLGNQAIPQPLTAMAGPMTFGTRPQRAGIAAAGADPLGEPKKGPLRITVTPRQEPQPSLLQRRSSLDAVNPIGSAQASDNPPPPDEVQRAAIARALLEQNPNF